MYRRWWNKAFSLQHTSYTELTEHLQSGVRAWVFSCECLNLVWCRKWGQLGWKLLREMYAYITSNLGAGLCRCCCFCESMLQLLPEVLQITGWFWGQAVIKALAGRKVTRRCCFTLGHILQTNTNNQEKGELCEEAAELFTVRKTALPSRCQREMRFLCLVAFGWLIYLMCYWNRLHVATYVTRAAQGGDGLTNSWRNDHTSERVEL